MRRPNHASRFEGIAKTNLQASRASDTETLQSQVNKAAEKRLSLSGLEILHGRLDILAERARKVGGTTIRSIGHIAKLQRIKDNDKSYVPAIDMLLELMNGNKAQIHHMRAAHEVADRHEDVATASLLENFIDEAEKRCWFLFEASRQVERSGH